MEDALLTAESALCGTDSPKTFVFLPVTAHPLALNGSGNFLSSSALD